MYISDVHSVYCIATEILLFHNGPKLSNRALKTIIFLRYFSQFLKVSMVTE